MISTGNNHLRLDAIDRLRDLNQRDVMELTKRRPNWHKEMEQAFFNIQDALEPVDKIACEIEEILAEREKQAN